MEFFSYAQDNTVGLTLGEPTYTFESSGTTVVNVDIYLRRLGRFLNSKNRPSSYAILDYLDLTFDIDATAFDTEWTNVDSPETQDKFVFDSPWNDWFESRQCGILLYETNYAIINYKTLSDAYFDIEEELPLDEDYKLGTLRWRLLPGATHFRIVIRDDNNEEYEGRNTCGALNYDDEIVNIICYTRFVEGEVTNPYEEVDPPTDLAGNFKVCGTPQTLEYTVTRPASVDSCAWFISTDVAGTDVVGSNIASIQLSNKGEKATITWKKSSLAKDYYIQVKSVKGEKESNPIYQTVRVEDFLDFADEVIANIDCRETQLTWTSPKDGITIGRIGADGVLNISEKTYTAVSQDTCFFVRYRDVAQCRDTVKYPVSFLDPKLEWVVAPVKEVQRGDALAVAVADPKGVPTGYTPSKVEYKWIAPKDHPVTAMGWRIENAVEESYAFEVYAEVDGCPSDTLTDTTIVVGGGILPGLSTESGQQIACKDGGVLLTTKPEGGSGNYSYKWYADKAEGTVLATTADYWAMPTKDTEYFVVVTDETSKASVSASIQITYKNLASPVVSAGDDQQILKDTYTHLLGSVVTDGASTNYTWNWKPADFLADGAGKAWVRTVELEQSQEYTAYVVDDNGCMSKPDSVKVNVMETLSPDLEPDDPSEVFALAVVPGNATLCKNNSVQFGVKASGIDLEGATYSWTPATGLDATNVPNPVLTATDGVASGDYFVTVTKGDFSIVRKASVTVNTAEEAPQLRLADNRMSCTGDVMEVVTVSGNDPDRYVWIVDGSEITNPGNSYTLADVGEHTILVYGKNTGAACASDTLKISGTIGAGVHLEGLITDVRVCGEEAELKFTSMTPADVAFKWLKADNTELSTTEKSIKVTEEGEYRLVRGTGVCMDTSRIQVKLNNVLVVEGLKPVITGCGGTAELTFDTTSAPAYVWLDPKGNEIADSRNKKLFTVSEEGIYQLRLDGGDCQETYPVTVALNTNPVVNEVPLERTTCGEELAVCGSASAGELVWATDAAGNQPVADGKLTGNNETKHYYVYADAGNGCRSGVKEVEVTFGAAPKVLAQALQTTCGESAVLQAVSTGTGGVRWYESLSAVTPLDDMTVTGTSGSSREYWVCAYDDEDCQSDRIKVAVKFGVAPALEVEQLQTTCGTELELVASVTGGKPVWKESGADRELLLTKVTGNQGEIKYYQVYAQDGDCQSETRTVEVRFGANPEVLANNLYTTCGTRFTLTGSASAGKLQWFSDAAGKNPLASLMVDEGTDEVSTYYVKAVDGSCVSPLKDVRVAFNSNPYVEALPLQTACGANGTIALKATTTGGTLVWEDVNGTELSSALVSQAGIYYVYAKDGSCKSTKEQVEVKFGETPVVNAEPVQTVCGQEYTLKATASGGTLKWFASQDGDRQEISTFVKGSTGKNGIYYVQAVDGNCASGDTRVEVRFGTPPTVTLQSEISTCEDVVKLEASTTGGSLYWREKGTDKMLPIPQVKGIAGTSKTYVVYAQDATCKSPEKELTIHFGNKPKLEVATLQTACGEVHNLTAQAEDDAIIKWLEADKNTELTSETVNGTTGGSATYWVYADREGCRSDLTEVKVAFGALPEVKVVSPMTTCGNSIMLSVTVSGGSAVWKKADGSSLNDLTVTGIAGAKDVYYVHAEDGSCIGSEEKVEVRFGAMPQVIVEKDITVCGEEYVLTAEVSDPSATLHWLEEDMQTPVTVATGTSGSSKRYYVYAENGQNCEGEMVEVTVHFGASPILKVDPITTCGRIAVLTAESSVKNLIWSDANGNLLASNSVEGDEGTSRFYYVQAQDGQCLSKQEAVRVDFGKAPELLVENLQTVCSADEYELKARATGKAELTWYLADGVTSLDNTTVKKVGSAPMIYYVEARDGQCVSDKEKVSVLFDAAPLLELDRTLQTTCGGSLTLQASASAGEVVWTKEDGTKLDLPQVSGTSGEIQHYYVYAQDGACESVKKAVEVHFGVRPELDVNQVQTDCGESHELTAIASDGVIHWLAADRRTELTSITVSGTVGSSGKYYVYAENGVDCHSDTVEVNVMFGTAPMIVEAMNPQTTCGSQLQLTAKATAGQLEWRDAMGILLVTPLVTQTVSGDYVYYVQAKDETCAGASVEVTARFGSRPAVICEKVQTTCGTSLDIVATATEGILHYLDTDGKTELASATVNVAGTYYVYAKAPDCISDTVAVEVKLSTTPEVFIESPQSTCEDVLQLQATATGGQLFWEKMTSSGTEPLLLPQVTAADGITTCYVYAANARDDESCWSGKKMVQLDFGAKPEVFVEQLQTSCATTDYALQATASEGAHVKWLASDGVTLLESAVVSGDANTGKTYWVYAEKGACRSDLTEVTVAFGVAPIVSVLDTLTSCGTELTLQAKTSAGTLKWLLDDQKTEITGGKIENKLGKPQEIYVCAQDGQCESMKHKVMALFKTEPRVLAELLQTTCDADSYELQAQATDGTLHWLDADKNPLSSTMVKGRKGESRRYYVYAEKDASCKSREYEVTVEFGADPMLEVLTPQTACADPGKEVTVVLKATATGGRVVWEDENGKTLATPQQKETAPTTKYYYVHAEDKSCSSVKEKVEVRYGGRPEVLAEALQTACGESLTLQGRATNGSLVWTDASGKALTSLTVNKSQGNVYKVKATEGECASEELTVNVVFETSPVVTVVTPQTTCGTQLQLEAKTTGGELVWLNANNEEIKLTQVTAPAGTKATYFVYAKGDGCESPREMVTAEFGVLPEVLVVEHQTACGTSHELTATATAGELIWLDDKKNVTSTTATGKEGESKVFYVYAKTADCEGSPVKVTVTFGQPPVVNVKDLQTTCGESLMLQASVTAGKAVWMTADGTELATPMATGTAGENAYYYVKAVDGSCESVTERVEVRFGEKPQVLLSSNVFTTCEDEYTLEAEATSGVVDWYASEIGKVKLTSPVVRKPADADYAEYYAEAWNGDCVGDRQKVTVVFGRLPLVAVTIPQTTCGDQIVLSATTTGGSIVWTDSQNNELASPLVKKPADADMATYYVQARDEDGSCASESHEVTVHFGVAPSVKVLTDQTACSTETELQATATGGDIYWLKSDKTPLASTKVSGQKNESKIFYVYAGDGSCTSDTVEVAVTFGAEPRLNVVDVQTSCGETVELKASASGGDLKWTLADGTPILPAVAMKPTDGGNSLTCYVEAVDGTCTSGRKPVTVKFGAAPEILVATLQTSCDTVYTLQASASSGNIVWEDENYQQLTSTTVHGTGIKTYYVYTNAGKDCMSEKVKVEVAFGVPPVMTVEPLQTSCGEALELKATATAGVVVWENETGAQLHTTTVTPDMGDSYRVYALDGKCKSRVETVTVQFHTEPIVTVEPLQTTCGTELTMKASTSDGKLIWLNGRGQEIESRLSAMNGQEQTVYVYAEGDGCESEPVEVKAKFNEQPKLRDLQSRQTACSTPYQLQANATGGTIVWLEDGKRLLDNWVDLTDGDNIFWVQVEDASCSPVATAPEKVTVTLGGRPELVLTTTQCAGDTIRAEEVNAMEDLTYRWFVNGKQETAVTGAAYVFTDGGDYTVKVVAEVAGGCVSDTVTETYHIAVPIQLAWDPAPAATVGYGNNIRACVKAAEGADADITWHWVSPLNQAITGACANFSAKEPEYEFVVYATDKLGCVSDTLTATTQVTGFGELDVVLESATGTEICKDGSALLTATVNGGQAPYTYEWFVKGTMIAVQQVTTSSVVNTLAVAPQADVTYVVKVRDAQVKPGIANKEIALTMKEGTVPVADAGPDMTIGRGLKTLLKAGGGDDVATWKWLPVEQLETVSESGKQYPMTAVLSTSQKYQLYVSNAEGCVSQPDEVVVYVLPLDGTEEGLPTPPVTEGLELAVTPEKDTLCLGTERQIAVKDLLGNVSGNATYTWTVDPKVTLTLNTKRDSAVFNPTVAGDYTFSIFVEDGDRHMALRSEIHVKDAGAPAFDLAVTGGCQSDTVKMVYRDGSVKADTWEWKVKGNTVANDADYYVLSATGDYKVEVMAANGGCGSTRKSADVTVAASPVITALEQADSCGRAVLEVTATGATAGYTWTANPTGEVESGVDNRYVITKEGKYEVNVKASNGVCTAERSIAGEVYARPQLLKWATEPMNALQVNTNITAAVSALGGKPAYLYHWLQPEDAKAVTEGTFTQFATLASYAFEVYASDANGCMSDTLKKSVTVDGGRVDLAITSVYGKEICAGGAAMLVARAQGVEQPCLFEWYKEGVVSVRRSAAQNSEFDTLWIKASEVGDYKVQVKRNATSPILASAKIDGLTVSASKQAPEVQTERVLTIPEGGKTVLFSSVSGGTPGYAWHWSPADRLENLADTALQYPYTAALMADQNYQVYVTDAASCVSVPATTLVDVDNIGGICVDILPEISEICKGNTVLMNAMVTCGKPDGYDLEYTWLPADRTALLSAADKDTARFIPTDAGKYDWVVVVTNGQLKSVARATVDVKDAGAPILALEGRWDCVNDTLILINNGEAAERYVWSVDGIEVAETGERLVVADASVKRVRVHAVAANGCLSDSISVETQLGIVPEVEIAGGSFVNYPDSVNILRVKQTDGLTVEDYDFVWSCSPDSKINGATNLLSVVTYPMTEDVKYTFTATSKANAKCYATDTVWGYMIPKAAPVGIDKDETSGDLYLAWSKDSIGAADSVRVMNIKWDGYAVESYYKPLAMAQGETEKYIIDTSKDTLEFFYINASRYIPEMGRSYYSLSSDTVGYFKQWVISAAGKNDEYCYIAYPFDMTAKGFCHKSDLIKYLGQDNNGLWNLYTIADYTDGSWIVLRALSSGIMGTDSELVPGKVYRMGLRKIGNKEMLLYGKLPVKFSYEIKGNDEYTYILTPLTFAHSTTRYLVGDKISGINQIASFNSSSQSWGISTSLTNGWMGTMGDFNITVFRPLRVKLKTGISTIKDWKY